jgi:membrane protein involved in colicin uptake
MSDPTNEPTEPTAAQGDPVDKPLGEGGEKALKAEREARKAAEQAVSELQKQIDAINAEKMSDLERAQKAAKDAEEAAAKATSEALRLRVAAKHGISDEDADLFLTGSDVETLERQAARLVERNPSSPKPDPSQGAKGSGAKGSPADSFAEFFQSNM